MKFNIWAFALTCGIVWGFGLFILTWWIIMLRGPMMDFPPMTFVYPGYFITPVGSLVGLAWGFIDGLIGGLIFAGIYNALSRPRI